MAGTQGWSQVVVQAGFDWTGTPNGLFSLVGEHLDQGPDRLRSHLVEAANKWLDGKGNAQPQSARRASLGVRRAGTSGRQSGPTPN